MSQLVFEDKDFLVKFLYTLFETPSRIKIQKTLYLLFAFYGATYGSIESSNSDEDNEFSGQEYPKYLFDAQFEAWKYGPVENEIYAREKRGQYEGVSLSNAEIDSFFDTIEKKKHKGFH